MDRAGDVSRKGPSRRSAAAACLVWPWAARGVAAPATPDRAACPPWPLWEAFCQKFLQADGRVIDDQHKTRYTTSEGQAYALFFALVANDRARFDTLLRWTEVHLAAGDLTARLPGWRWGQRDSGEWGLVDANAASDADLWMAYTLYEAARLWNAPVYRRTAHALLVRVEATEMVRLPRVGWMVLPGPAGFQTGAEQWRFNPSYLPLHQLRYFATAHPDGPWESTVAALLSLLGAAAPRGFVPDWVEYSAQRGWHATALSPAMGSYDAIRTYLWAGLVHRGDPARAELLSRLGGMRAWLAAGHALPPQQVQTHSGEGTGPAPPGFGAALLPYLEALGAKDMVQTQLAQVRQSSLPGGETPGAGACAPSRYATALLGSPPTYFDQVLALFGQGALEGRYRLGPAGALEPAWRTGR